MSATRSASRVNWPATSIQRVEINPKARSMAGGSRGGPDRRRTRSADCRQANPSARQCQNDAGAAAESCEQLENRRPETRSRVRPDSSRVVGMSVGARRYTPGAARAAAADRLTAAINAYWSRFDAAFLAFFSFFSFMVSLGAFPLTLPFFCSLLATRFLQIQSRRHEKLLLVTEIQHNAMEPSGLSTPAPSGWPLTYAKPCVDFNRCPHAAARRNRRATCGAMVTR